MTILAFANITSAQVQTEVPGSVPGAKPVALERIKIHGASLEGNLEGDDVDRTVIVFLPPSYVAQKSRRHFEIGKKLASLRDEQILTVGSGKLVHNLHAYAWGRHMPGPYDWAVRFGTEAKEMMLAGEYKLLIDYEKLGREALLSIPTPDHYLPLLYVMATRQQGEPITFPAEGVDGGSISVLNVQIG